MALRCLSLYLYRRASGSRPFTLKLYVYCIVTFACFRLIQLLFFSPGVQCFTIRHSVPHNLVPHNLSLRPTVRSSLGRTATRIPCRTNVRPQRRFLPDSRRIRGSRKGTGEDQSQCARGLCEWVGYAIDCTRDWLECYTGCVGRDLHCVGGKVCAHVRLEVASCAIGALRQSQVCEIECGRGIGNAIAKEFNVCPRIGAEPDLRKMIR